MVCLFIWQLTILHHDHLKFSTHHRINACPWKKKLLASHDLLKTCSYSSPVVLTFYHFLSSAWIFESLQNLPKLLETLQRWPSGSSLMKKLSLEYSTHILVLFWSLPYFTFIPFKVFLCSMFVHLGTHHTASRSLEIFHASMNQCIFIRKLSLSQSWFNLDMFL